MDISRETLRSSLALFLRDLEAYDQGRGTGSSLLIWDLRFQIGSLIGLLYASAPFPLTRRPR